jgi:linoleoyl-CoA desaturase
VALLVPAGLSDVWWVDKHNGSHHGATGVAGHDTDIDYGSLMRLVEAQAWRPWHRYQAVYVPLLYPLAHLAMAWASLRYLVTGRLSTGRPATVGRRARAFGVLLSLGSPAVWLVPALWLRPAGAVLAAATGVLLVSGLILSAVFQVEHQLAAVTSHQPDEHGLMACDWLTAQLVGAADVATHRRLATFYVGALNHHVEHHLFPRVPIADLPRIRPIVQRAAAEHGVTVATYPSFRAAWVDHVRFLHRLGRPPVPATTAPPVPTVPMAVGSAPVV